MDIHHNTYVIKRNDRFKCCQSAKRNEKEKKIIVIITKQTTKIERKGGTQDHNNEYNISSKSFRRAKDAFSRRDASRAVCSWTGRREKTVETAGY